MNSFPHGRLCLSGPHPTIYWRREPGKSLGADCPTLTAPIVLDAADSSILQTGKTESQW